MHVCDYAFIHLYIYDRHPISPAQTPARSYAGQRYRDFARDEDGKTELARRLPDGAGAEDAPKTIGLSDERKSHIRL